MSIVSPPVVRLRGAVAACLGAVLLVSCSSEVSDTDAGASPTRVDAQATADDGQEAPAGRPGDVQIGTELPDGFPADVPLVEGTIVSAGGTESEGIWVVMIQTSEPADSVQQQALERLRGAGYTEYEELPGMNAYAKDALIVTVRAGHAESGDGTVVNYTIHREK